MAKTQQKKSKVFDNKLIIFHRNCNVILIFKTSHFGLFSESSIIVSDVGFKMTKN